MKLPSGYQLRKMTTKAIFYIVLIILLLIIIFPVYWMFSMSIRPVSEYFSERTVLFPKHFNFEHFIKLFSHRSFLRMFLNSLIVSVCTTLITIIVGLLGGYAAARFSFIGRSQFTSTLLLTQMFPGVLLVIPLLKVIEFFGLYDTYYALVISYIAFSTPFSVWILKGYIETIPVEIEQAGLIDGCSTWGLITRILVPIIKPGLVSVAIYTFMHAWGEFIFVLTFIESEGMKTLPIGLAMAFGEWETDWGVVYAFATIYTLPVLLLFAVFQRYLVKGLAAGSLKA